MTTAIRANATAVWRAAGRESSPWAGLPCRVLLEGPGPGPRNVLVQVEDGRRVVLVRRDKSLRVMRAAERQVGLPL